MHIRSSSFVPYQLLDTRYAFGQHHPQDHFQLAGNVNPHLAWDDVPAGTRSLVLLCVDEDVPSVGDDANQEGRTIDVWLPRVPFFHWILVDLPPDLREIAEGTHSNGPVPGGKTAEAAVPDGGRSGLNTYTQWFAGDETMGGDWFGYDGPAPPWNDERMHAYRFQIHALDVARLDLPERFDGAAVREAVKGHVLDSAEVVALYAINPEARGRG